MFTNEESAQTARRTFCEESAWRRRSKKEKKAFREQKLNRPVATSQLKLLQSFEGAVPKTLECQKNLASTIFIDNGASPTYINHSVSHLLTTCLRAAVMSPCFSRSHHWKLPKWSNLPEEQVGSQTMRANEKKIEVNKNDKDENPSESFFKDRRFRA